MGPSFDRRFMLITPEIDPKTNCPTNMHVSGFTSMCLFTTHIPDQHSSASITDLTHIEVRYALPHNFTDPGKEVSGKALTVPLTPEGVQELERLKVKMHGSPTWAHDMGAEYNGWFSERFGFEVKLLYLGDNRRKVLGNIAPAVAAKQARGELAPYQGLKNDIDEEGAVGMSATGGGWLGGLTSAIKSTVSSVSASVAGSGSANGNPEDGIDVGISFADVAPFLIISATSHADAASRFSPDSEQKVDITKFRPNIVVEGAGEAWEEDYWAELAIKHENGDNDTRFVLTQNCARCNSLNVDYQTGKVEKGDGGALLRALMKDRRVDPGSKWSPIFGRYGFLGGKKGVETLADEVMLSVGDDVEVVRRNEGRTSWGEFLALMFFILC